MNTYRSKTGDTLDMICLNHYGNTYRYVEEVLQANPGLACLGPILPSGIIITLPHLTTLKETKQMINLWD